MMKHLFAAVVMLGCTLGIALGDTIKGVITKIDGNQITVKEKKDTKTFEAAGDVRVLKQDKKDKIAVPGGLKAEALQNLGKGVPATLEVTNGKVTEILLGAAKKAK